MRRIRPVAERLWEKIHVGKKDDCWEWKKPFKGFYPSFTIHGGKRRLVYYAYQAAFRLAYGPPPKGKYVLHKCGNRKCCNPNHLYVGTQRENVHDAIRMGTFKFPKPRRGSDNEASKLVEPEAKFIRDTFHIWPHWRKESIAKAFGISRMTAYRISKGQAWIAKEDDHGKW